jgi:hypothetical protein
MTGFSEPERGGLERMQRLQTAQAHPEADLLSAFSEQTLTAGEREQVLSHLAVCATCREVIALASPATPKSLVPQAATNPTLWKWSVLRWGAVAASAVIVVVAVSIGHYENQARKTAQFTSDASPIAVPATAEQKVVNDEAVLQAPASSGVKAPQIRYEKIAPKPRKDDAIEHLNASFQTDSSNNNTLKKELNTPVSHGAVGGLVASRTAAPADFRLTGPASLAAGSVQEPTAEGLAASLEDNALRRAAPAPGRAPGMEIKGAAVPYSSESVMVTAEAPPTGTQAAAAPEAVAKAKQEKVVQDRNKASLGALNRDKQYNSLDLKWQVTPEGLLQNSTDQGRNWIGQLPDQRFTHVQTVGNHVWASGSDGVLVHSTDGGVNWTRLTPAEKDVKLQGEINSIVFTDVNHGTLKTSAGETWTTADAGQSWKKN